MSLEIIIYYLSFGIVAFFIYLGVAWIYLKAGIFLIEYILTPLFSFVLIPRWLYLKKNSEKIKDKKHIAILLCNNYMPEKILTYRMNISKLVKYFRKKDWSYKIYFNTNKEKLVKVINDPNATILYIIGHGQRHGVRVNKKEIVYYCEFEKSPRKKFIAQLHCNHYGGKSLADYISENSIKGFVTNKKLTSYSIDKFIDNVVKGEVHGGPENE